MYSKGKRCDFMKDIITSAILDELNRELSEQNCVVRFRFRGDEDFFKTIERVLVNEKYIDNYIINLSREFLTWLEKWFKNKGIKLCCNADASIFWGTPAED